MASPRSCGSMYPLACKAVEEGKILPFASPSPAIWALALGNRYVLPLGGLWVGCCSAALDLLEGTSTGLEDCSARSAELWGRTLSLEAAFGLALAGMPTQVTATIKSVASWLACNEVCCFLLMQ